MEQITRGRRLRQIAQQDDIYRAWESGFQECSGLFHEFADTCSEDVRGFLYGYAEYGRMMMQRMVNLACEHMKFPDEMQ